MAEGQGADWTITVRGFGVIRGVGATRSIGMETLGARFVRDVLAAGHDIKSAEILAGKQDDLVKAAKILPLNCGELFHAWREGEPVCVCGKLKPKKVR